MMLLAGLATAILVWWGLKFFAGTNPARLAKVSRTAGGVAALGAAAVLLLRGRMDIAFLLGSGGAWLLGWNAIPMPFGLGGSAAKRQPKSVSRVRSARIEMILDHDTGIISGKVTAGPLAGSALDDLSEVELLALRTTCLADDRDGGRLLESYLDRRNPLWREHAEPDPDGRGLPDAELSAMSQEEAYQVLGLQSGAGEDAVRTAHRALMKKLHPDQGGSTYLASRVNQAKDVLLDRHR